MPHCFNNIERVASMARLAQHPQANPVTRNPAGISADMVSDGLLCCKLGLPSDEEYRLWSQMGPFLYYFLGMEPG